MLKTSTLERLPYHRQIKLKQDYINKSFFNLAKVEPFILNPSPTNYRHKVTLSAVNINRRLRLGLYVENTKRIKPGIKNILHDKDIEELLEHVEKILQKYKITAYDEKSNRGIIKHILVRKSNFNKQLLISFVTNKSLFPNNKAIVKDILDLNLKVTSISQIKQFRNTKFVLLGEELVLHGKGYIEDRIFDNKFYLSAQSFFQVNPMQMINLYSEAIKLADLKKHHIAVDAYGGMATIALSIAKDVKKVYSIDSNHAAFEQAKLSISRNKVKNVTAVFNDVEDWLFNVKEKIDFLFLDPPRSGASSKFIRAVLKLKPTHIIYISCEPTTLIRDLNQLKGVYNIDKVIPVDMFSYTEKIETIVKLTIKKEGLK